MKSYPNIEKSGFRPGEYVGYSEGRIFRIRRVKGAGWEARAQEGSHVADRDNYLLAVNLDFMSAKLANMTDRA